MEKIAVATDFSVRSDRALLRATLMARRTGARLVLLHVVDEDQPRALIAAAEMSASSVLNATLRTLHADGIAAEPLVTVADVANGILDAAARTRCDLVVLGPHRNRALDVFTGTTVERVVRLSRMPVLVAPRRTTAPCSRWISRNPRKRRASLRCRWACSNIRT